MLGPNNWSFLVAPWSTCTHTYFFWSSIPLKAVIKMIQFRTFKIIWAHSENTRNESVRILRIPGMNLFVYWEYAKRICMYSENMRNEENIRTKFCRSHNWEYAKWICSYTENMQNESVRILRIRGMNLYIYWEYAECTKSWISRRIRNKNWKYFRMFIRSLDGFVWLNHLKPKNLMQVYLYGRLCPS
jgi:hypothetical protein